MSLFTKTKMSVLGLTATIATLTSCRETETIYIDNKHEMFKVQLLNCEGDVSHEWISTEYPQTSNSGVMKFIDNETKKPVLVRDGTLIATPL